MGGPPMRGCREAEDPKEVATVTEDDHADMAIKPPFLFVGALFLGCLLTWLYPIGPGLAAANGTALAAGLGLAAAGMVLTALSIRAFARAGTSVAPTQASTTLVTTGPYGITRNPIYIGFVLVYVGFAIVLTSVWLLLLLIPVLFILQRGVVEQEEAYLEGKFGEPYRKYRARVPRWL
jgi:protein-S-isoprenylcysteine O-methyltransferase Ste14